MLEAVRQSIKGIKRQQSFDIKQMNQKSNFSIPEDISEKPKSQRKVRKRKLHRKKTDTSLDQKQNDQMQTQQTNNKKSSTFATGVGNQEKQIVVSRQLLNSNQKANFFTFLFYFGIITYLTYSSALLLPVMIQNQQINTVTAVVLGVGLLVDFLLMIICYEKGRRRSPGYPPKLNQRFGLKDTAQTMKLQQVQDIRNRTIELLIEKAQLKQKYQKSRNLQNQQKIEEFQYKFFVLETRFCEKCENIKDLRVRHCSECNRCVERMDHHCVWMNNCVGKGNHKIFILLLLFFVIPLTFYTVVGAVDLIINGASLTNFIQDEYGGVLKIIHLWFILLAAVMWFYYVFVFFEQLYLIANNLTFVESLSKVLAEKKPWKQDSICANFSQVFGSGCWICPTQVVNTSQYINNEDKKKKTPSVELVQQVYDGGIRDNLRNFQSENNLRHQKNQI